MATRRDALAEGATDYALEHGLIGLSLRPLAQSLGTSDRMLLYHFQDKDDLVATIVRTSSGRSMESIRALPTAPDLRQAVRALWREVSSGRQQRCQRLYVEAAALGLFGKEAYADEVRAANRGWMASVADHFVRAGLDRRSAQRVASMVDAAFTGLLLDQPLSSTAEQRRTVADLAEAVAARWGPSARQEPPGNA